MTPAGGGNGNGGARPEGQGGRTAANGTCPVCAKPTADDYRPFCSKRCADVDLHRWLRGGYAIPATDQSGRDDPDGET